MAPRLDARVNAVNEGLVGLGLHCWLLAPLVGVWKLLLGLAGRLDVTNFVSFSPPSLLAKVMAEKRI